MTTKRKLARMKRELAERRETWARKVAAREIQLRHTEQSRDWWMGQFGEVVTRLHDLGYAVVRQGGAIHLADLAATVQLLSEAGGHRDGGTDPTQAPGPDDPLPGRADPPAGDVLPRARAGGDH